MLESLRRDERVHPRSLDRLDVLFAEVSGVCEELFWLLLDTSSVEILLRLLKHRSDLSHVIGLVRDVGCHDDLLFVRHCLSISTLIETFVRRLHDLRFGIGEVALVFVFGNRFFGIFARLLAFSDELLLMLASLLFRLFFQRGYRFLNLLQSRLSASEFVGDFFTAAVLAMLLVFSFVSLLSLFKQVSDLLLKSLFFLDHPVVAHRFVTRCVRLNFRTVQSESTNLHQPCFST